MAILNQSQREKYATVGKDRYPINDKNHAKAALSRLNQGNLSPEQKMKVMHRANAMLHKGK